MQFDSRNLKEAIDSIAVANSGKTNLSNKDIRFTWVDENHIRVSGGTGNLFVECNVSNDLSRIRLEQPLIPDYVDEFEKFFVDGDKLIAVLGAPTCDRGPLSITPNDSNVKFEVDANGGSVWTLGRRDGIGFYEDFFAWDQIKHISFEVDAQELKAAIQYCRSVMKRSGKDNDFHKKFGSSSTVYFQAKSGQLRIVSTDSVHLSLSLLKMDSPSQQEFDFAIPGSTRDVLAKMIGDYEGTIRVRVLSSEIQGRVQFDIGSSVISSAIERRITPPYQPVIVKNDDMKKFDVGVDKKDLINAIDSAMALASTSVSLTVSVKDREIRVVLTQPDEGCEGISYVSFDSDDAILNLDGVDSIKFCCDGVRLRSGLSSIPDCNQSSKSDQVRFVFSRFVNIVVNDEDSQYKHLFALCPQE